MKSPALETLFFCFGPPKSGTTLLQRILDTHPEVACPSEHQFAFLHNGFATLFNNYHNLLQTVDKRTGRQGATVIDPDTMTRIFTYSIRAIIRHAARGKPIMGANDNTILKNLDLYARLFESPPMIAIFRNPIDVGISSWHHNLRLAEEEGPEHKELVMKYGGFEGWLKQTARWFTNGVDAFKSYTEKHDNTLLVRYEDLVSNKTTVLEQIFTFLGASTHSDIIGNIVEATSFTSMKNSSSRPGFFRMASTTFGAGEVSDSLRVEIADIAAPGLEYVGYDVISSRLSQNAQQGG